MIIVFTYLSHQSVCFNFRSKIPKYALRTRGVIVERESFTLSVVCFTSMEFSNHSIKKEVDKMYLSGFAFYISIILGTDCTGSSEVA